MAEKVSQQCQLACQCRRYPPLPPPPPPPPPPRLLGTTGKSPSLCSPGITPVSLLLSLTVLLSVCSHPAFKAHPKPDAGVNWLVWKKITLWHTAFPVMLKRKMYPPPDITLRVPEHERRFARACDRASRMLTAEHKTNLCRV